MNSLCTPIELQSMAGLIPYLIPKGVKTLVTTVVKNHFFPNVEIILFLSTSKHILINNSDNAENQKMEHP